MKIQEASYESHYYQQQPQHRWTHCGLRLRRAVKLAGGVAAEIRLNDLKVPAKPTT
jgi:hypothetical protein